MEEREKRKIIAEEKHKEWVQKKNEEVRRKKCTHTLTSFFAMFFPLLLIKQVFPNLMDIMKSLSSALCSLLLSLFPHVAPSCIWLQVIMKSVPRSDLLKSQISIIRSAGTSEPANLKQPIFSHSLVKLLDFCYQSYCHLSHPGIIIILLLFIVILFFPLNDHSPVCDLFLSDLITSFSIFCLFVYFPMLESKFHKCKDFCLFCLLSSSQIST